MMIFKLTMSSHVFLNLLSINWPFDLDVVFSSSCCTETNTVKWNDSRRRCKMFFIWIYLRCSVCFMEIEFDFIKEIEKSSVFRKICVFLQKVLILEHSSFTIELPAIFASNWTRLDQSVSSQVHCVKEQAGFFGSPNICWKMNLTMVNPITP